MIPTPVYQHAVLAADFSVNPAQPPNTDAFQTVLNYGGWIVLGLCVIGLLIAGGRMALLHHRGQGFQETGLLGPVLACIIVGASGGVVGGLSG